MKKRIIAALLCLALLLPFGTVHAAGSAGDPLISQSYINGTFIPGVISAVKSMVAQAVENYLRELAEEAKNAPPGMVTQLISPGGSIAMATGQTVILLSGSAQISISSGSVVNATVGYEAYNGALNLSHRYIVCEESAATVEIITDAMVFVSSSASITPGDGKVSPFSDVKRGDWYFEDVVSAYERGLVNGMTPTSYEPSGTLTLAQAIKLAACMHQLYNEGSVSLENSEGYWYRSFVDYALEKGIISGEYENYDSAATRQQFIEIFYSALPESEYEAINSIPDGSIGDLTQGTEPWVEMVYSFYRAGILTGYTADENYNAHDFGPETTIIRAEVATIMNRMFDHSARQSFTIE